MRENELIPGAEVITSQGHGVIVRHKPGNFRGQDYEVLLNSGHLRWYNEKNIATPEKYKRAS